MTNKQWRESLGLSGSSENGLGSVPGEQPRKDEAIELGVTTVDVPVSTADNLEELYYEALERQQKRRENIEHATGILAVELVA